MQHNIIINNWEYITPWIGYIASIYLIFRYLLAVLHAINCIMLPIQLLKTFVTYQKEKDGQDKKDPNASRNWSFLATHLVLFVQKYILNPILIGLILYGRDVLGGDGYGVRVCIAFSLINTSYLFLASIGTLPWIGTYTNMISKVIWVTC